MLNNNSTLKRIIGILVICALILPSESAAAVRIIHRNRFIRRHINAELPPEKKNPMAMNDTDFVYLCYAAPLWQIEDAIKNGANARAVAYSERYSTLMCAAHYNEDPEVISALFRAGADVNAKDIRGQTPLIHAVYNSNPEMITALLNVGALTGVRDNWGRTAMDYAELFAKPEAIKILQETTPATQTKQANSTPSEQAHISQVRIAYGSNSELGFFDICKTGSLEQINRAIENGANVNTTNTAGMTAFMWAADSNPDPEVVTILIRAGANINAQTKDGWTPLIWAAYSKKSDPFVITILLYEGANPKITSSTGKKAIDYARENDKFINTEALSLLQEMSR